MALIPSVAILLLGLLTRTALADKDDSYYIAGTGNPNVNEQMYWKDAYNILQDLNQFQELYVDFHQCAWTWMQGMEEADNDVDENDYWYMGKIPPMGANVAFSLYGSLKNHKFTGCNKESFINSFYTSNGFNDFATAMYYAGVSGFSDYASDDDGSSALSAECYGGYGVGCDANGFGLHTYSTDSCDPQYYKGVKDNLSNLNKAMSYSQCVKIYDAYSGYSEGSALDLLSYSHSCFYQDVFSPDGECPDPYGKLAYYQEKFHKGIVESRKADPYQVFTRRRSYLDKIHKGKLRTSVSMALFVLAALVFFWDSYAYGARVKTATETMRKRKKALRKLKKKEKRAKSAAASAKTNVTTGSYLAHEDGTSVNGSIGGGSVTELINQSKSHIDVEAPAVSKSLEDVDISKSVSQDVHLGKTILFDVDGIPQGEKKQSDDATPAEAPEAVEDEIPAAITESELIAASKSTDEVDQPHGTQDTAEIVEDSTQTEAPATAEEEKAENKPEGCATVPSTELPPPSIGEEATVESSLKSEQESEKRLILPSRSIHSETANSIVSSQGGAQPPEETTQDELNVSNLSAESEDVVAPEPLQEIPEEEKIAEDDNSAEKHEASSAGEILEEYKTAEEEEIVQEEQPLERTELSQARKEESTTQDDKLVAEENKVEPSANPERDDLDVSPLSEDSEEHQAPEERSDIASKKDETENTVTEDAATEPELVTSPASEPPQQPSAPASVPVVEPAAAPEPTPAAVTNSVAEEKEETPTMTQRHEEKDMSNLSPDWADLAGDEESQETQDEAGAPVDDELLEQILFSRSTDFEAEE